jgi:outer membrane receptor for ferrienterochelin and colicins
MGKDVSNNSPLKIIIIFVLFFATWIYPMDQKKQQKKINKYFKMSLHELMGLEMATAGKKKEKIGDIPASVILLTREDIETAGYQTLLEILESIPGLYVSENYLMTNIGVRGFMTYYANRNMIFLVNGIPQRDEYFSNYILGSFPIPVEAIDRIEVVRGPMSAIYGAGAFFGVVNIITNQPMKTDSPNMLAVSFGSEKTGKFFARASGKSKEFQYVFNGSYFATDGIDVPMEKIGGDVLAGLTTENHLERREKVVDFTGKFKDFSFALFYAESQQGNLYLLPPVENDKGSNILFKNMRLNVEYKKTYTDAFRLESKIGYYQTSWDWEYRWIFENFYSDQQVSATSVNAELSLFINPTDNLGITVGLNYLNVMDIYLKLDIPLFNQNRVYDRLADGEDMVTRSLFVQLDYKFSKKLQMVAGMMIEQTPKFTLEGRNVDDTVGNYSVVQKTFDQTKALFIPRFALIYKMDKNNIFKILYGKAFDRPAFFMNRDLLTYTNRPPLEPENIQTFELNYIGHLSSKVTFITSVFRNNLDNLIFFSAHWNANNILEYYSTNNGKVSTTGVEFTVQSDPLKNLRLELSGTYLNTQDKRPGFEDIDINESPKFLGYFKASYFFSKELSLALSGNYVDSMEAYYDVQLDQPVGDRVPGYFLIGANLRVRNLFGIGMFLNLRCSNLLNEEIRYPATPGNTGFAKLGTLGRSRSFLLTLGWKF